jgi:hypothetical protein
MKKHSELPIAGCYQVADCNGEQYLNLCQRAKRGEIIIEVVLVGAPSRPVPWLYRVQYLIQATPTETVPKQQELL